MKYRLLIINEKELESDLEFQASQGYQVVEFLKEYGPNASSDITAWKVLLAQHEKAILEPRNPDKVVAITQALTSLAPISRGRRKKN